MGAQGDRDLHLASDPRTPPAYLADLAARRPDLHAVIAANPAAYPALRDWIAAVGAQRPTPSYGAPARPSYGAPEAPLYAAPAVSMSQRRPYAPLPPRRRRGAGGWLAGCGCLTVIVLVVAILGGGALLSSDDGETGGAASTATTEVSRDPAVAEQLAILGAERVQFYELYEQIDNPVAPLVADLSGYLNLLERTTWEYATVESVQDSIAEARERRQELQDRITAAEGRRTNISGTHSEGLIDSAGDGFIKVDWEAATACNPSDRPGFITSGCVYPEDPLLVHLLDESEYVNAWELDMVIVHELAHVYQRTDSARFADFTSEFRDFLDQGMFQGEMEAMADCYALTYFDEWSLENGAAEVGYGYVCNESERDVIREWAASLGVVMPG